MPSQPPLRAGVLLDKPSAPAWVLAILEAIQRTDSACLALVVFRNSQPKVRWREKLRTLAYGLYCYLDRQLFRASPDALAPCALSPALSGVPLLTLPAPGSGDRSQDLARVAAHELDVLVHLGRLQPEPELAELARFGLWSFDPAFCASTAGFHQVFAREPVSCAELHLLGKEGPAKVLCCSYSGTHFLSVHRNRQLLYWKGLCFVPRKLRELHRLGGEAFSLGLERNGPSALSHAGHPPSNGEFLRLLAGHARHWLGQGLEEVCYRGRWMVMLRRGGGIPASLADCTSLIPPLGRSWADPFPVLHQGKYYLFVEELEGKKKKGHLCAIELDNDLAVGSVHRVLERPYHLSYPFVFAWEGEHYLIPETSANRTIEAYRCRRFPQEWVFHKNLMTSVKASDATLFCHAGKWWLFACLAEHPAASTRDELFLFYSDHPLSHNWTPHPRNPIVSDVRRARPAGRIFEYCGKLYRPAQDCSVRYGYGLRLHEIIRLDQEEYEEREVKAYLPEKGSAFMGLHTFNQVEGLTVVDAKVKKLRFTG